MPTVILEQALFVRERTETPGLAAQSPGFLQEWIELAQELARGFGLPTGNQRCGNAIFGQPLGPEHVAVVRVRDREPAGLLYHVMVLARTDYEDFFHDPFAVGQRHKLEGHEQGGLPSLTWDVERPRARTVAQVQRILQRLKTSDGPRTAENSESPALLGGTQVLLDGGKLVFRRPRPDPEFLKALWTLLPYRSRCTLWPASFTFSNELTFDVLVAPPDVDLELEGYTTEDEAADYPQGNYELGLQAAAEAGDQRQLDGLFFRRTQNDTLRMAMILLLGFTVVAVGIRLMQHFMPTPPPAVQEEK